MSDSKEFQTYLEDLALHEQNRSLKVLKDDPRETIKIFAGHKLNWLGDFFGNPNLTWQKIELNIKDIGFTGSGQELNQLLLYEVKKSPAKLKSLILENLEVRKLVEKHASFDNHLIVVRKDKQTEKYPVLDGTHRLLGFILQNIDIVTVWYPVNEFDYLPQCEAHVVYDLIRGYTRNAKNEEGKRGLYYGLNLLARSYGNVLDLLKNRFNENYIFDEDAQQVISKVIANN